MKVIFRFLAKVFSDVETETRDDGVIIRQVTYK